MFHIGRAITVLVVFGFILSGCASHSHEIQAAHVSTTPYEGMNCQKLHAEMQSNFNRINDISGMIDKKADDDEAQMAIGMILFWPTLFALEGGDGPEAAEYSRLKGEVNAMETVAISNECTGAMQAAEEQRALEHQARMEMKERYRDENWGD